LKGAKTAYMVSGVSEITFETGVQGKRESSRRDGEKREIEKRIEKSRRKSIPNLQEEATEN